MDDPRPEKVGVVSEVRNRLDQASAAILTEYRGLTVKDLATLRRSLRDAGGEYRIYKNTLVRFAAHDLGLDELVSLLEGPTAIAFIDGDAVPVAKALRDYARTNTHLVIKGGVLGSKVITSADTAALADLPPRDVVLARLAGALAAPIQQFAGLLQALPRNFAYGLKALIEMGGAPGSPAAEVPPAGAAAVSEAEPASADDSVPVGADVAAATEAGEPEPAATEAPVAAAEPERAVSEAPAEAAEPEPAVSEVKAEAADSAPAESAEPAAPAVAAEPAAPAVAAEPAAPALAAEPAAPAVAAQPEPAPAEDAPAAPAAVDASQPDQAVSTEPESPSVP